MVLKVLIHQVLVKWFLSSQQKFVFVYNVHIINVTLVTQNFGQHVTVFLLISIAMPCVRAPDKARKMNFNRFYLVLFLHQILCMTTH